MNGYRYARTLACALVIAGTSGCQYVSELFEEDQSGPAGVNELVERIERVYVHTELSKNRMHEALAELQTIARSDLEPDAETAYARLLKSVEASEEQAATLEQSYHRMKRTAEPFFAKWEANLDRYTDASMRVRSQSRLTATRQRYDTIVAAVQPGLVEYQAINKGLRDYTLFLGHDLNPSSLTEIQEGVRALVARSGVAEKNLDSCLVAVRAYVDSTAVPVSDQAQVGDRPAGPAVREVSQKR